MKFRAVAAHCPRKIADKKGSPFGKPRIGYAPEATSHTCVRGVLALFGLVLAPVILKPLLISALSGSIMVVLFAVIRSNRSNRARRSAWKKASALISNNLDDLTQRRTKLVCQDAYDRRLFDEWTKEMEHFIDNHISPVLAPQKHRHLPSQRQQLAALIGQLTYLRMQEEAVYKAFSHMRSTGV